MKNVSHSTSEKSCSISENGINDIYFLFYPSRGEHKLDSLGSIQTKVTVSGTDDVYQTTQKKMKLADEEMKKVR